MPIEIMALFNCNFSLKKSLKNIYFFKLKQFRCLFLATKFYSERWLNQKQLNRGGPIKCLSGAVRLWCFFFCGSKLVRSLAKNTLLLNEGIPRAYRGKKLCLKNILFFPSKSEGITCRFWWKYLQKVNAKRPQICDEK